MSIELKITEYKAVKNLLSKANNPAITKISDRKGRYVETEVKSINQLNEKLELVFSLKPSLKILRKLYKIIPIIPTVDSVIVNIDDGLRIAIVNKLDVISSYLKEYVATINIIFDRLHVTLESKHNEIQEFKQTVPETLRPYVIIIRTKTREDKAGDTLKVSPLEEYFESGFGPNHYTSEFLQSSDMPYYRELTNNLKNANKWLSEYETVIHLLKNKSNETEK